MNRWQLELKKFKIDDVLHPGTRLWIVPNEDWEEEYIREDRAKVLSDFYTRASRKFSRISSKTLDPSSGCVRRISLSRARPKRFTTT